MDDDKEDMEEEKPEVKPITDALAVVTDRGMTNMALVVICGMTRTVVKCGQDPWKILNIFEDSVSSLAQFQVPKKFSPPPPVIQDADGSLVEDEEAAPGIQRTRLRRTRAKKGMELLHGIKPQSSSPKKWKSFVTSNEVGEEMKEEGSPFPVKMLKIPVFDNPPDSSDFPDGMSVQEDGSRGGLVIRRVKKEKDEKEDLEFEVELRRVSADGKLLNSVVIQDSPPEEEEIKTELEEQNAQEFEVQKVTIPIDGSLASLGHDLGNIHAADDDASIKACHLNLGCADYDSTVVSSPCMVSHDALCADPSVSNGHNDSEGEDGDRLLICSQCGKGFHLESSPQEQNQEESALGEGPYSCTECGSRCWT
ncbi:hypothetical protein lerEdw1_009323 [Lerista edwardsae]|nr:hypothetical protein lerEdw1_009323 [Lerista edwardsae]